MLKALQIQELVKGGEGYNVDFKRTVPSKVKEISDEVASFANAAGSYVTFRRIKFILPLLWMSLEELPDWWRWRILSKRL